jgi:hypothetical protein
MSYGFYFKISKRQDHCFETLLFIIACYHEVPKKIILIKKKKRKSISLLCEQKLVMQMLHDEYLQYKTGYQVDQRSFHQQVHLISYPTIICIEFICKSILFFFYFFKTTDKKSNGTTWICWC